MYLIEDNIYPIYTRGCIDIRGKEVASLCGWEQKTLLLATKSYLKLNGYFSLFPLRILRYVIGIAGTMSEEQMLLIA
ncbi:MAG: hypothetical protein QN860_08925 [Nitrososphaeraceae archaeon]|nr:hypothetical protein [Nitrososphaeraceae archaeon]